MRPLARSVLTAAMSVTTVVALACSGDEEPANQPPSSKQLTYRRQYRARFVPTPGLVLPSRQIIYDEDSVWPLQKVPFSMIITEELLDASATIPDAVSFYESTSPYWKSNRKLTTAQLSHEAGGYE